ncbi:trypsin-like serine peptidase [Pukyongiella litopenaei]|uniref:Trypsin-like peptidase domain-containing protein n=1 Tax=Pukyongiella litopenaei TaxID=2605946 RepID=A0A2S0MTU9_9RHOB|nr:serine protease [Pukyongiella litopenaei]AVO39319.1 trypsin-like peptidase domain-containing protein [Pukyongiella litopenaei]
MAVELTEADLAPVLRDRAALTGDVLEAIYADHDKPVTLEALRVVADSSSGMFTTASLLLTALTNHGMTERFVAAFSRHGVDLLPGDVAEDVEVFADEYGGEVIGDVTEPDFDHDGMLGFLMKAKAYRCRILVDGQHKGSGALISRRLVITADHVVEQVTGPLSGANGQDATAALTRIEVESPGGPCHAMPVWWLPVHDDEREGRLPPASAADTHCDVALLRLHRPLGRIVEPMRLPPVEEIEQDRGPHRFALLHYPKSGGTPVAQAAIRRDGPDALREFHTASTEVGSSGGPGFDREFRFIGLHQGRWQAFRRIVPYVRFARHPGFRAQIDNDVPPIYLWSVDGSLDGDLVIGRSRFFDALDLIVNDQPPMLRGVWIKRTRTARSEGMSFSHRLLRAFLSAHGKAFDTLRIPTGLEIPDLTGKLAELAFGSVAAAGYGAIGEQARAHGLAARLQDRAATTGRPLWLYFEAPPKELPRLAQIQLEHLLKALLQQPDLRIVLAGFETYTLPPRGFGNRTEVARATAAGLMVEYMGGHFSREDVDLTALEMDRTLALGWEDGVRGYLVEDALTGIPELQRNGVLQKGVYDVEHIGAVADNLRNAARKRLRMT